MDRKVFKLITSMTNNQDIVLVVLVNSINNALLHLRGEVSRNKYLSSWFCSLTDDDAVEFIKNESRAIDIISRRLYAVIKRSHFLIEENLSDKELISYRIKVLKNIIYERTSGNQSVTLHEILLNKFNKELASA